MIIKMRIDDRLLHGQVAYSWKSYLAYDAIVIANNNAANNDITKSVMKMAKPDGVNLAIRTIDDAATLLKNKKLENMKVFVIVNCPRDAHELFSKIEEQPELNLGAMQKADHKVAFSNAVFVSKEDIEYLDKLHDEGIKIEVRQVPSEAKKDYMSLRNKMNK